MNYSAFVGNIFLIIPVAVGASIAVFKIFPVAKTLLPKDVDKLIVWLQVSFTVIGFLAILSIAWFLASFVIFTSENQVKRLEQDYQNLYESKGGGIEKLEFDPFKHMFFDIIDHKLKAQIDFLSTGKENPKDAILRDMLRSKLTHWQNNYYELFKETQISSSDFDVNSIGNCIRKIINEYNEDWNKLGIPDGIIEKFNIDHTSEANTIVSGMKLYSEQNLSIEYSDFVSKFLNLSLAMLDETPIYMQKIIAGFPLSDKEKKYVEKYKDMFPNS